MAYYDALRALWATQTGTTAAKLAAVNAMTVAGPNRDVPVSLVIGFLLINQAYFQIVAFSQSTANGNPTHDIALIALKTLVALASAPNAPNFAMSDPPSYAAIKALADAALAQELAAPGTTGFTQAIHDGLLALGTTSIPWWQANGYTSPFNANDLAAAGGLI